MNDVKTQDNPLTKEFILKELLNLEESLESKTDISNPKALTGLFVLAKYLEKEMPKLPEGNDIFTISDILFAFIEMNMKYMTSKDGTRAKQICEAISALNLRQKEIIAATERLNPVLK